MSGYWICVNKLKFEKLNWDKYCLYIYSLHSVQRVYIRNSLYCVFCILSADFCPLHVPIVEQSLQNTSIEEISNVDLSNTENRYWKTLWKSKESTLKQRMARLLASRSLYGMDKCLQYLVKRSVKRAGIYQKRLWFQE